MKHKPVPCPAAHGPQYPNAADDNYFAGKALEILMGIFTSLGAVTAMALLLAMA